MDELIPVDEEEDEEEGFDLSKMDRKSLKSFIKEKGFEIKVIASYSDDKIRNLIQDELDALAAKDEQEEKGNLLEEPDEEDNDEQEDASADEVSEDKDEDDDETEKKLAAYREKNKQEANKNKKK